MSAQMSTAMMSAPCSASATAWLRPCPRAAPVMTATEPSSSPMTGNLQLRAGLLLGEGPQTGGGVVAAGTHRAPHQHGAAPRAEPAARPDVAARGYRFADA